MVHVALGDAVQFLAAFVGVVLQALAGHVGGNAHEPHAGVHAGLGGHGHVGQHVVRVEDAVVDHLQRQVHRFLVGLVVVLADGVVGDGPQGAQGDLGFFVDLDHAGDPAAPARLVGQDVVARLQLAGEDDAWQGGVGDRDGQRRVVVEGLRRPVGELDRDVADLVVRVQVAHVLVGAVGLADFQAQVAGMDGLLEGRVAVHLVDVGQVGHAGFQRLVQRGQDQVARLEVFLLEGRVAFQTLVFALEGGRVGAEEQPGELGGRAHVEREGFLVAGGLFGEELVGDQRVVQVAVLAVLGAARIAQVGDDLGLGVEAGIVGGAGAAAAGLHVGVDRLAQGGQVGQLALVLDQTAAHRVALAAGDQVAADPGRGGGHAVGDVVADGQGRLVVVHHVQAARGEAAQLRAQVHVVGRGRRDPLGGEFGVEAPHQVDPALGGLVFRQGHGHAHVDELLGLVFLPGDAVLQAVLLADVVQREVRRVVVLLVVDEGLDLGVFGVGVVHAHHHPVGHHAVVQRLDGGDARAVDDLVQVGRVEPARHQVVGPGVLVEAVLDQLFLQVGGGDRLGHGADGLQYDAAPVDLVAQVGGGPSAPAIELAGDVGFDASVTLDDVLDHGLRSLVEVLCFLHVVWLEMINTIYGVIKRGFNFLPETFSRFQVSWASWYPGPLQGFCGGPPDRGIPGFIARVRMARGTLCVIPS